MMERKYILIRVLSVGIGIIGFIWFFLPILVGKLVNIGSVTGVIVSVILCVYGVKMKFVNRMIISFWHVKVGKILLSFMGLGVSFIIVLTTIFSVQMLLAANHKPEEEATVVVLGCRVYGERASLMLRERITAAKDYLQEHPSAVCILSGGKGKGEDITEAECMYRYLVAAGIEPSRLYKEEASTSTRENISFSKRVIERERLNKKIAIVTNEFHEYRAGKIAEKIGMEAGAVPAKTAIWLFPTYYVRELYGILYEMVLD